MQLVAGNIYLDFLKYIYIYIYIYIYLDVCFSSKFANIIASVRTGLNQLHYTLSFNSLEQKIYS